MLDNQINILILWRKKTIALASTLIIIIMIYMHTRIKYVLFLHIPQLVKYPNYLDNNSVTLTPTLVHGTCPIVILIHSSSAGMIFLANVIDHGRLKKEIVLLHSYIFSKTLILAVEPGKQCSLPKLLLFSDLAQYTVSVVFQTYAQHMCYSMPVACASLLQSTMLYI